MKPARLLQRLDAEIAKATDAAARDCLRAERAGYLARRGEIRQSRAVLTELRQAYQSRPNAAVSAWLNLSEGFVIHFSDMGTLARDKIYRAFALSESIGLTHLSAISAAWLANMDYLRIDMDGMVRHVSRALQYASKDNHSALSRASLVIAHALHLGGRIDLARPWYLKAHTHASFEGDDTTTSALIHNMAWLRAANLRQETLCGTALSINGEHALTGADSSVSFDQLIGITTLDALTPVLRAQLLALRGEFAAALLLYEEHLQHAVEQGLSRLHATLLSDQAWCRLRLGQEGDARRDAESAELLIDPNGQPDDRAPAHSRLAMLFCHFGNAEASKKHERLAQEAWRGHEELQLRTVELLSGIQYSGA